MKQFLLDQSGFFVCLFVLICLFIYFKEREQEGARGGGKRRRKEILRQSRGSGNHAPKGNQESKAQPTEPPMSPWTGPFFPIQEFISYFCRKENGAFLEIESLMPRNCIQFHSRLHSPNELKLFQLGEICLPCLRGCSKTLPEGHCIFVILL